MCKVLIKEVVKVLNSVSGGTKDAPWERFEFDCLVSVDGSEQSAVRRIKTFDAVIAKQLVNYNPGNGAALVFDAKPYGEKPNTSFTLESPKKGKGPVSGFRGQVSGETNRQTALKCAVEAMKICPHVDLSAGASNSVMDLTLKMAAEFLAWLDASPSATPSQGKGGAK